MAREKPERQPNWPFFDYYLTAARDTSSCRPLYVNFVIMRKIYRSGFAKAGHMLYY